MSDVQTLVLNNDYTFLNITNWFEAFCLILEDKAIVLENYHLPIRSQNSEWDMPAIIMMKNHVRTKKLLRKFSPNNKNLLMRDGFRCAYCSCKLSYNTVTRDHIIPQSKGGKSTFMNLVSACKSCNGKKADYSCSEIGMHPQIPPRDLSNEERLKCLVKSLQSRERMVWLTWLKENDITLW